MKVQILVLLVVTLSGALAGSIQGKRLIKQGPTDAGEWMTKEQIYSLIAENKGFQDITDHPHKQMRKNIANAHRIPDIIQYGEAVNSAISKISITRMQDFLTEFSSYPDRQYDEPTGAESANWLKEQLEAVVVSSGYKGDVSVTAFPHRWVQDSIIARIEGADPTLKNEVIVLGAHEDSLSFSGNAPGADDNGSGSTTLLEAFTVLLESGFVPKRTVEFHWYAAEEVGLLGSQDIAEAHTANNVNVVAMANFDVTGYQIDEKTIGITTDYTTEALSSFIRDIVDAYLDYSWTNRSCGYSCSDHASWYELGYSAVFPVEYDFSPYMHSPKDTIDTVNFEQVQEFVKLACAFAVELAEPFVA